MGSSQVEIIVDCEFRSAVKFKEGRSLADSMSAEEGESESDGEVREEGAMDANTVSGDEAIAETNGKVFEEAGKRSTADVDADDSTVDEEQEPAELTVEELLAAAEQRADVAEKEIGYRDAEIQNVRKRMAAEKSEAVQYAGMGLARRMLAVLDDVDRALSALPEGEEGAISEGLQLMRNRLWQELSSSGVREITTDVGFDPNLHEAITTIPASEEIPAKSIVSVLEPGYRYKERIIKAARVVVAAAPQSTVETEPDKSTESDDSTIPGNQAGDGGTED